MRVIVAAIAVLGVGHATASGQTLLDAGIRLAAVQEGIHIYAEIGGNPDECPLSSQVLEAEAERAVRRDGITRSSESLASLGINVIVFPEQPRRCVTSVNIDLWVVVEADTELVVLAARANLLLTGPESVHAGRVRTAVEEGVSVIANALRRARDDQEREQ